MPMECHTRAHNRGYCKRLTKSTTMKENPTTRTHNNLRRFRTPTFYFPTIKKKQLNLKASVLF